MVDANPLTDAAGNLFTAIFLDGGTNLDMLDGVTGRAPDETLALGIREIYVHYGSGIAATKLRTPAAVGGTARNMNIVSRLAEMAAGREREDQKLGDAPGMSPIRLSIGLSPLNCRCSRRR